ncbi:TPA: penicillin-binding protein 2, partial [Candidatus Uhrbacteria bacterium]|nr:penicillin-binding protein 2 [Candidatus Uhrbacteria bacterium]
TLGQSYRNRAEPDFMGTSISGARWKWAGIGMACIFLVLLGRSAQLQIWQGNAFYTLAEGNRIREEVIPADRGRILDRAGTVLVQNIPAFSLWVSRDALLDQDAYVQLVDRLAALLEGDARDLHDQLLTSSSLGEEILITHNMPTAAALEVLASPEQYPQVRVEAGVRRYDSSAASKTLSALLGYTGAMNEREYEEYSESGYKQNELIGKIGIEESYEQVLRGFPGERRVEVDAVGRPQSILEKRDAVDGATLMLHIDAALQSMIEEKLVTLQRELGILNASVIVMDPRDGGVRALVSYPGFDSNLFMDKIDAEQYRSLLEDPARPLFSRAISGQYPSGSTFKPIVAAAALDAEVITEHTTLLSNGGIRIGQFYFPDWKAGGHGMTNVRKALADSVNTFFYMIGGGYLDFEGLGLDRMMTVASSFGLGKPLGIDVPHEASGFLPSALWKNEVKNEPWYIGDTYHVAIGQGDILVTPLQVAAYTSAFANGGTLYTPQVVDRYESQGKMQDVAPRILSEHTASPEAIEIVREGLRQTVTEGSGKRLNTLPIPVAGKTGTAQWHNEKENHAWFTGFAPYDNPELVVTILIEEGGEGSTVAVPLAYTIFDWWFQH